MTTLRSTRIARSLALALVASVALAALPPAASLPTPGLACDLSEPATGRLFPEPENTNDYISYAEAKCGLEQLQADYPARVKLNTVAQSVGWDNLAGGHDTFDVWVVEVTNFESNLSWETKPKILFQLSIHGNEKGGREGGLRVIEDFAKGIGMAAENPELVDLLDYFVLLFAFPNPDGWVHEEAEYRHNDACYTSVTPNCDPGTPGAETQNFVRVNGNGKDLNRQTPTVGWAREGYEAMGQPEQIGLVGWLKNITNIRYATDIHGMLNPADGDTGGTCANPFNILFNQQLPTDCDPALATRGHFVLTMLPAGRFTPQEMVMSTSLAERVKEYLNSDPYFTEWQSLPTTGAWGGEYNNWGTVWDTIGYTDSGFTSDFYAQDRGLNAPGVDFELAYNHITFDNYYPGLAQRVNMYHVETVREIVRAFMDQAALDVQVSIETSGLRTLVVNNPTVVTNADNLTVEGWAAENPADDAFDIAHNEYEAAPNDYWTDLAPFLRDGDAPGVLELVDAADLDEAALEGYDNLVVAGSAYQQVKTNPGAIAAVKSWVEAGGRLLLTDEALQMLVDLELAPEGSVDKHFAYAGATNLVDRESDLAKGTNLLGRMLVEPVPVGYSIEGDNTPVWFVDAADFEGEVVGVTGVNQAMFPDETRVNYGRLTVGSGTVTILGSLLPDPSDEFYHPYGLDSYATTYTANLLVRNALGWDEKFEAPPVVLEELGQATTLGADGETESSIAGDATGGRHQPIPAPGALLALGLVAALALALRRRT